MDVAASDLARVSKAIASVGMDNRKFFASVARASVARADRFTPGELVSLAGAFERAQFFQTALFEVLCRSMTINVRDVCPKDVTRGMLSLANCGIHSEELGRAIGEHVPKKAISTGIFTAEESCTLAWSFCALGLHHDKLFRAVFRALEDAPLQASQALCQLYEIHLTLRMCHPSSYKAYELEDDTVQSLKEHYSRSRRGDLDLKPDRSSEKVHAEVAEVLRQVLADCSVSVPYTTSHGLTTDIAATPRAGSGSRRSSSSSISRRPLPVLVDVDGPHSVVRSLDKEMAEGGAAAAGSSALPPLHVRGAVALQRRLLQRSGACLVVLSEETWKGLGGQRERRDFLRSVLRRVGVGEDNLL